LNWPGGSEILSRTASRLLPEGTGRITIVPDGLGYVLIGSVPDLASDVVLPLRRAGYDNQTIAALVGPVDPLE
jgi:mannose-6-phosphate isomerase